MSSLLPLKRIDFYFLSHNTTGELDGCSGGARATCSFSSVGFTCLVNLLFCNQQTFLSL